ncbi:MAG TPA: hypothetical protein ENG63_08605 [Candidatus Desulfofervidus auxilii]|uniref:Right handed beta helix domain-containing protein n=1 Tax=Desulfofervidus auxilii TaxID=1621989 RepID=A0A7C0U3Q4_DESA2|nr:hypothetical protein [Candidatus Desulfofervidus auxilii]
MRYILTILISIIICSWNTIYAEQITVHGRITQDTTWQGNIWVIDNVTVSAGVTLRIMPGTKILFKHYRGYKEPNKRLRIDVLGGNLIAEGTPDFPIYFTSDSDRPQNGDWSMIHIENSDNTRFKYCVIEFAQQGLNIWHSNPLITNSVIRWNNWEGLYFESYSQPIIENCQIYENGYNGLAAEQFNSITIKQSEFYRNGTNGIHIDASTAEIIQCNVHSNLANGISVDDNGLLKIYGCRIYDNMDCAIGYGEGENIVELSNTVLDYQKICGNFKNISSTIYPIEHIEVGFSPDNSHSLNYIPGDKDLDRYRYVYPDYDVTRKVLKKIGEGLGLTWSLTFDGTYLWTATLDGKVYKIAPNNGDIIKIYNTSLVQPWGMTFDGNFLWIVDFAQKKLFKFDPNSGRILDSFETPDPVGGCKGITWDGDYLYLLSWTHPAIYKLDTSGNLLKTIDLKNGGGGGITWDGNYFWVSDSTKILKYDKEGNLVGWIYSASEGTWDLAWDGEYLWASQRTNENWNDAKIFQIQVLNDSLTKTISEITINGQIGNPNFNYQQPITISISLIPFGMENIEADWWIVAKTPFGVFFYSYFQNKWDSNITTAYQGKLQYISDLDLFTINQLPVGNYTIYFGVDTSRDGNITFEQLFYDYIEFIITD